MCGILKWENKGVTAVGKSKCKAIRLNEHRTTKTHGGRVAWLSTESTYGNGPTQNGNICKDQIIMLNKRHATRDKCTSTVSSNLLTITNVALDRPILIKILWA